MQLLQYPQGKGGPEILESLLALESTAWPSDETTFPSAPNTYVTSFILLDHGAAVCHVGVRKGRLHHRGEEYLAYGLSEVVTHPRYRRQGLASRMIKKAAQFIRDQQPDISIFTCEQHMAAFYAKGGWSLVGGACFVGGTREKPFRSDGLRLVTMMMFLSQKGKKHRADFENTDIVFELGENQLW